MSKTSKTENVNISLTAEQKEKAKKFSMELFGKVNVSSFLGFLIEKWEKENIKK